MSERDPAAASTRRSGRVAFVLTGISRMALCTLFGMLVWTVLPAALGWHSTVVMTGSMRPQIQVGDVVVARPTPKDALQPGQILLVDSPDHAGQLRLHRFVRYDSHNLLVLRGDANKHDDSSHVHPSAVHGVAALRIPFVGSAVVWAQGRNWLAIAATAVALLVLLRLATWWRAAPAADADSRNDDEKPRQQDRPTPRRRLWLSLPTLSRVQLRLKPNSATLVRSSTTLVVLLILLVMTDKSTPAFAGFAKTATNSGNIWTAAAKFQTCAQAAKNDSAAITVPMNETSGTTAGDVSGNAFNGTYQGGYSLNQAGPCPADSAKSVAFNGSTGYISNTHQFPSLSVFTAEVWFKTTSSNGGGLLGLYNTVSTRGSGQSRYAGVWLTNSGNIQFQVSCGSPDCYATSSGTYNDGNWHLMTATVGGSGQLVYIDGTQVASNANTSINPATNLYWRVGQVDSMNKTSPPTSDFFNGNLAFASIWTTQLSATQIAHHYAAGS